MEEETKYIELMIVNDHLMVGFTFIFNLCVHLLKLVGIIYLEEIESSPSCNPGKSVSIVRYFR